MKHLTFLACWFMTLSLGATVRVYVQDINGLAWIKYECTGGEIVRSFALDVTVDQGVILEVSNFLRGPSTAAAPGYGIFPAAFRDHVTVLSGTNADWSSPDYNPVANAADRPTDTLPGLNSNGVTLEMGALWDPSSTAAIPPLSGTLCALRISQIAKVGIIANASRGGVVGEPPDVPLTTQFSSASVDPRIGIIQTTISYGVISLVFKGGELQTAPTPGGPWTGTGNTSGSFSEPVATTGSKFYRVNAAGSGGTVNPQIGITQTAVPHGVINLVFKGGELQTAPAPAGPWTGTGNTSGTFDEPVAAAGNRFYRVHRPGTP